MKLITLQILFLLITSIPVLLFSQEIRKPDEISIALLTDHPENQCISISNPTDSIVQFSIRFNDGFYPGTNDIIRDITKMNPDKDSLFFYAWIFVCKNTYFFSSLHNDDWAKSVLLHLNSVGYSLCGGEATLLSKIWKLQGYKTRLWALDGHAVPEVMFNNKWQMLDPSYHVYFLNKTGEISSVEEIFNAPDSLLSPENTKYQDFWYYLKNAPILSKTFHSSAKKEFTETTEVSDTLDSFVLQMPPNSRILFPAIYTKDVISAKKDLIRNYANCKLIIPPEWNGSIKNSLIIADITGKGIVNIGGTDYATGSDELRSFIQNQKAFISEMIIKQHTDSLEIIYFMNPCICEMKKENTLFISGTNVMGLKAALISIPDSVSVTSVLKTQGFFYNQQRVELINKELSGIDTCMYYPEITRKDQFLELYENYLDCRYGKRKQEYLDTILENKKHIFDKLPENYNFNNLFFILKYIPLEIFFYDIEHASQESVLGILNAISVKELKQ